MPAYWFVFVVASLASASFSLVAPVPHAYAWLMGLAILWTVAAKVCGVRALLALSRGSCDPVGAGLRLEKSLRTLRWCWVPAAVTVIAGTGLAQRLDQLPVLTSSDTLRAGALLLPGLFVVFATLWVESEWAGIVCQAEPAVSDIAIDALDQMRLQAGWLLLPLAAVLIAMDACGAVLGSHSTGLAVTAAITASLLLPLSLPWLIRLVWRTERITDGELARLVRGGGCWGTDLRLWKTGDSMATAVAIGLVPGCRMLLVSDGLTRLLPPTQLRMVLLHEIAHFRRWHVPLRMLSALPVVGVALLGSSLSFQPGFFVAAFGLALIATLLLLRWVSVRTEFDADATACRLACEATGSPQTLPEASRALASALQTVCGDNVPATEGGWLHPSLDQRLEQLERLAAGATAATVTLSLNPQNTPQAANV